MFQIIRSFFFFISFIVLSHLNAQTSNGSFFCTLGYPIYNNLDLDYIDDLVSSHNIFYIEMGMDRDLKETGHITFSIGCNMYTYTTRKTNPPNLGGVDGTFYNYSVMPSLTYNFMLVEKEKHCFLLRAGLSGLFEFEVQPKNDLYKRLNYWGAHAGFKMCGRYCYNLNTKSSLGIEINANYFAYRKAGIFMGAIYVFNILNKN